MSRCALVKWYCVGTATQGLDAIPDTRSWEARWSASPMCVSTHISEIEMRLGLVSVTGAFVSPETRSGPNGSLRRAGV